MSRLGTTRYFVLLVVIFSTVAGAQPSRSSYDPMWAQRQKNAAKSVDNHGGADYGQWLENGRAVVVQVIEDGFYWYACVTSWMALILLFAVFHQGLLLRHRQRMAAAFLASYHNALLDARDRATEEHEDFARFCRKVDERDIAASLAAGASAAPAKNARSANEETLTAEINTLRIKMGLMEKTEKGLRQENAELKRMLRDARDKNRAAQPDSNGGQDNAGAGKEKEREEK
jgi:hypothetical protein